MKLPDKVDLRDRLRSRQIPILDDGDLGCSTASAIVSMLMYQNTDEPEATEPSKLFLYYRGTEIDNG